MRLFLMAATAAGFALSTITLANSAIAVRDTPTTVGGIETVCTGVGASRDDPRWKAYPVKIVLAASGGDSLADAHVALARGGEAVAALDCDAPWVLLKPPPGRYTATLIDESGRSRSVRFTADGRGPQREFSIPFL